MLKSAYCLSRTNVFEWRKRIKEGQESLQDIERKGHPSTSGTEGSMVVIQKCLAEDCFQYTDDRRNDRDQ